MADSPDSRPAPARRRTVRSWMVLPLLLAAGVALLLKPADPPRVSGPISQEAYVWQRAYTPEVAEAIRSTGPAFSGLAVLAAEVSFVASEAEFTPPVIFSQEARDKLVFLVEAAPLGAAADLKVGQPVDVTLPRGDGG